MTSTAARSHSIYKRIVIRSRPEVEAVLKLINDLFKRKKRGAYNKDPTKMKNADGAAAAREFGRNSQLPEGFTQSINSYIIKEGWKDFFEYICFSKVPQSWSSVFGMDLLLGEGCRVRAEYI